MKRLICLFFGHEWFRLQRILVRMCDPTQSTWEHQMMCNRCRKLYYGPTWPKKYCPGDCWLGCPTPMGWTE